MDNKIQKIRAEIERLYKEWDEHADYDRYYRGMADGLDVLEQFIDSLQDEPKEKDSKISEDIGKISQNFTKPSDDTNLDDEVIKFWNDNALAYRAGHIADLTFLRFAAQHFTKWQKERDEKDLTEKVAAAYQLGLANDGQMTKEVVDGFIFQSEEYYPKEVIGRYDGELKHGDKVKLIIIKVDEGI